MVVAGAAVARAPPSGLGAASEEVVVLAIVGFVGPRFSDDSVFSVDAMELSPPTDVPSS